MRQTQGIECVTCGERVSPAEIARGGYDLDSMLCADCLAAMQAAPYERSCFGKPTVPAQKLLGFDPRAEECLRWCPDRRACARIVGWKGK